MARRRAVAVLLVMGCVVWRSTCLVAIGLFALTAVTRTSADPALDADTLPDEVLFNRDVRPIFSNHCFQCHGSDERNREADVRLDTRAGLFADGDPRAIVVPGDVDASELFWRITAADVDERMPPRESGKHLTARHVALIRRWIEQGAPWQGHWSFIRPARPNVPQVNDRDWPRIAIDRFILAQLDARGWQPSPQADRRDLIRRLSFDLTGLPPTPVEVDAFLENDSDAAYERRVDRLLASPHYGERMAIHWLDLVRYADTTGYHSDEHREIWLYRDYVIDAFNENMPFDRFTIEQLAGDLLPEATTAQKIATGYNRLNQTTAEGGAQAGEYLAKYAADRVRTTSSVWLGATMGCAECHDHKFDPITMEDFYRFAAFFADVQEVGVYPSMGKWEPYLAVPGLEQVERAKQFEQQIAQVQKILDTPTPQLAEAQAEWETQQVRHPQPRLGPWHAIGPFRESEAKVAFDTVYEPETEIDLTKQYQDGALKWTARPEWTDGQVHTLEGDYSATYLYRTIESEVAQPLDLSLGSDDGIKVWINGQLVLSNEVYRSVAPDQENISIELAPGQNTLLMKVHNGIGGYAFYFLSSRGGTPDAMLDVIAVAAEQRTQEQQSALAAYYRSVCPELSQVRKKMGGLKQEQAAYLDGVPTTLVTRSVEPRTMRILPRGNWMDDSGEIVTPGIPAFVGQVDVGERRATRLDLARWLASPSNPLSARAFVNRLWMIFFDAGVSRVLDDLGAQGDWPTHPELLDWLAVEFMDSGWDVKHLVKLIVTSSTYRQSSHAGSELRRLDPYNRYLGRQSPVRLDAELVRDNALAISGLLSRKIGGPSVKPYQPAGYWREMNFPKRVYAQDSGESLYRRGLYTYWCRTYLHPSMLAFDAPVREECTAQRMRSNTPLQALVLLNDPIFVEAARVFAERIVRGGGDDVGPRLHWAFRHALSREANDQEVRRLTELHLKERDRFASNAEAAQALVSTGESPVAEDIEVPELAAWTSVARVILNLHETMTRY